MNVPARLSAGLQKLSIGATVMVAFGAVLFVVVGLGALAVSRIGIVNDAGQALRDDYLPGIQFAAEIADAVNTYRIAEGQLVTSSDADGQADARKDMRARGGRFDVAMAGLAALPLTAEEQGYRANIAQRWRDYGAISGKLDSLVTDGKHDDAADLLTDGSSAAFNKVKAALDRVLAAKLKGSADAIAAADAVYRETVPVVMGAAAFGAMLCLCAAFGLFRRVAVPVARVAAAIDRLAAGDLDVSIADTARQDEIGALTRAVRVFREALVRTGALARDQQTQQAIKERRKLALDEVTRNFGATMNGALGSLVTASEAMRAAAARMQADAGQTQQTAHQTTGLAVESSKDLSTVAAGTEELSASVNEIARQLAQATQTTSVAVQAATMTSEGVEGLAHTADNINHVVALIAKIASQTSLLALNATIEAARAGEAGKGFAVVASEVKALASQTANATSEISAHISAIRNATGGAVSSVRDVGQAIRRVNEAATAIAAAVDQQKAATSEIAASIRHVSERTTGQTAAIQKVAAIAEGAAVTSGDVMTAATEIADIAATLRRDVDAFFTVINAEGEPAKPMAAPAPAQVYAKAA